MEEILRLKKSDTYKPMALDTELCCYDLSIEEEKFENEIYRSFISSGIDPIYDTGKALAFLHDKVSELLYPDLFEDKVVYLHASSRFTEFYNCNYTDMDTYIRLMSDNRQTSKNVTSSLSYLDDIVSKCKYKDYYQLDLLAETIINLRSILTKGELSRRMDIYADDSQIKSKPSGDHARFFFSLLSKHIEEDEFYFPYDFSLKLTGKTSYGELLISDLAFNFQSKVFSQYSYSPWNISKLFQDSSVFFKNYSFIKLCSYIRVDSIRKDNFELSDLEDFYLLAKSSGVNYAGTIYEYIQKIESASHQYYFLNQMSQQLANTPIPLSCYSLVKDVIDYIAGNTKYISLQMLEDIISTIEYFNKYTPYDSIKKNFWNLIIRIFLDEEKSHYSESEFVDKLFDHFKSLCNNAGFKLMPYYDTLSSAGLAPINMKNGNIETKNKKKRYTITKEYKLFCYIENTVMKYIYSNLKKVTDSDEYQNPLESISNNNCNKLSIPREYVAQYLATVNMPVSSTYFISATTSNQSDIIEIDGHKKKSSVVNGKIELVDLDGNA